MEILNILDEKSNEDHTRVRPKKRHKILLLLAILLVLFLEFLIILLDSRIVRDRFLGHTGNER